MIHFRFNGLFDFYIKYYFHVAIAVLSLVGVSSYNFNRIIASKLYFLIFISTLVGYILTGYHYKFKNVRFGWKVLLLTILVLFFFFNFLIEYYSFSEVLIWLISSFLTFWYVFPIIPFYKRKITLRNIPQIKVLVVATVWTIVTVFLPFHMYLKSVDFWIESLQRFFLILALTIPFEIRDFEKDNIFLSTIPQKMGIENAKKQGLKFLLIFLILAFFKKPNFDFQLQSEIFIYVLSAFLIIQSGKEKSQYFTTFWVESVPIFWIILVWIFNLL